MNVENNHDAHDRKWMFSVGPPGGGGQKVTCLACIMELLESPDVLMIKKKPGLNQLITILNTCSAEITQLLKDDTRITLHMTLILLGRYWTSLVVALTKPFGTISFIY